MPEHSRRECGSLLGVYRDKLTGRCRVLRAPGLVEGLTVDLILLQTRVS
jgi:hypothetical protein